MSQHELTGDASSGKVPGVPAAMHSDIRDGGALERGWSLGGAEAAPSCAWHLPPPACRHTSLSP